MAKNRTKNSTYEIELRILELRASGDSFDLIAQKVGYSDRSVAFNSYKRALSRSVVEGVEELRALELARLDLLQASVWERALSGEIRAVEASLRIIDRRTRLLGLERIPEKEITGYQGGGDIDAEIERISRILEEHKQL